MRDHPEDLVPQVWGEVAVRDPDERMMDRTLFEQLVAASYRVPEEE